MEAGKMFAAHFAFLTLIATLPSSKGGCNKYTGPTGTVECVLLSKFYTGKQWSTCLTDSYIRLRSGGKHRCRDPTATYCWYQCMLETYGKNFGAVINECACRSDQTTVSPGISSTLPPWCFSPSGQDCSWYLQCLEAKKACEGSDTYAITYAKKYCSLYADRQSHFSTVGQTWINAVRKCLQVALVPLLRPWATPTCQQIRQTAFDSHTGCYLHPYRGAPSICDLPLGDWWKVFWTIKGAFLEAFVPSLKGMLETTQTCLKKPLKMTKGIGFVGLEYQTFADRRRRSVNYSKLDINAGQVADSIAKLMAWRSKGFDWFAYSVNTTTRLDSAYRGITIILADRVSHNVDLSGQSNVDVNKIVRQFADEVRKGKVDLKIRGGSDRVYVKEMKVCEDSNCKQSSMNVTAPPTPASSVPPLCADILQLLFVLVVSHAVYLYTLNS